MNNQKFILALFTAVLALSANSIAAKSQEEASVSLRSAPPEGGYLRSNVIFNEPQTHLRLSRTPSPVPQTQKPALPQAKASSVPSGAEEATVPPAEAGHSQAPPPAVRTSPLQSQAPVSDMKTAQNLLRQSLDATFYACDYLIQTGVNSRQFTVQEELESRSEMDGLAALNKSYAAKGYTTETFNEIQRKLVVLQLHLYTYGQNAATRQ